MLCAPHGARVCSRTPRRTRSRPAGPRAQARDVGVARELAENAAVAGAAALAAARAPKGAPASTIVAFEGLERRARREAALLGDDSPEDRALAARFRGAPFAATAVVDGADAARWTARLAVALAAAVVTEETRQFCAATLWRGPTAAWRLWRDGLGGAGGGDAARSLARARPAERRSSASTLVRPSRR